MPSPELSVVVPFYNLQDYLKDSLESIQRQTFGNFEAILVDDGSTDDGAEVARAFCASDSRFRLIQQPNSGVGPARNTGIASAQAPLLAFVDGDDLVPWNTYALLTRTLQDSGSSFALGNARRFSRTSGVRPSWTHQQLCAVTVFGTHVQERPSLIRDRMMWNKVYRRDFWDAGDYRFPAMRYEDYPVALATHFDALTVDVLSSPCYYWRVRESGDSITQQVFKYDNLLDRVISAEMILDMVEERAVPAVQAATHAYLAEIDLIALVQAFAVVPDEDVDNLLGLGDRLLRRLRTDMSVRPRFDQIQYHALRAHDVPLLRELAHFRDDGGLVRGVKVTRRRSRPWQFDASMPGRERSTAPQRAYTFPITALTLRTQVDRLAWTEKELTITGSAEIAHSPSDSHPQLEISAISGIERIKLPLRQFAAINQFGETTNAGFEATVDFAQLASEHSLIWPLRFEVSLRNGGLHRTTLLKGMREASPAFPQGCWLGPGEWIEPGSTSGGVVVVRRQLDPVVLDQVVAHDGRIVLTGTLPERCSHAELRISRPGRGRDVRIGAHLREAGDSSIFEAALDAAVVLSGDSPDDPFTLRAQRRVTIDTDLGEFSMLWPRYDHDVAVIHDQRRVSLTRTAFAVATLEHSPALPVVDTITTSVSSIDVLGTYAAGLEPEVVSWRRYLPNSDDHIDVVCDLSTSGDGVWRANSALADLIAPADAMPLQPGGPLADWALFVHVQGADHAVTCPVSVAQTLPRDVSLDNQRLRLTSLASTTRIQVR